MPRGSKPGERRGGRKKGVPNKLTGEVKSMILAALDKAGGVDYLYEQSSANPSAFMTLIGKVLPLQVSGDKDNPVELSHTINIRAVYPKHDASD